VQAISTLLNKAGTTIPVLKSFGAFVSGPERLDKCTRRKVREEEGEDKFQSESLVSGGI
jgi:hypothetical protein